MVDDGTAVGDEVFDVHGSFGFLGLETQDLKVGDAFVIEWADRWTSVAIEMSTIQGQPVVGIRPVTTVEGRMDRLHRLSHLKSGSLFLGSLGERHCCAVQQALLRLRDEGVITGWRDELYPVLTSFEAPPVLLMERAASVYFGIKAYGVHVNGYVEREDGGMDMWVARRAKSKPTWPGRLDHIVAGGQPHGISPTDNVVKECGEEAGIAKELAEKAVPVGAVSYCSEYSYGLKRDVLFCYDLKLPDEFVPVAVDGEVDDFCRMPVERVVDVVKRRVEEHGNDTYKDNCNLVVIDFLVRHGFIGPETPGYLDIIRGLRPGQELC